MIASWMCALLLPASVLAAPAGQAKPAAQPAVVAPNGPASVPTPALSLSAGGMPLQPLATFLSAAKTYAVDNREVRAQSDQQTNEAYIIMGRALPSVSIKGIYTRNQYHAELPATIAQTFNPGATGPIVIQATDQWDAYFTGLVPLIDVGTWIRARGASAAADALRKTVEARELEVQKAVARTFYQLVAGVALIDSAQRNLQVSKENLQLLQVRREGGVASELDVERAASEVENGNQLMANAVLSVELAKRQLQTLSGISPGTSGGSLADDLHQEGDLEQWEQAVAKDRIPGLRAAELNTYAADKNATGSYLAFLPTVLGTAQEHLSTITGFTGQHNSYLLSLTASWNVDFTTYFTAREQSSIYHLAQAQEERARLAAADNIHNSWFQVQAQIAKSRAAQSQVKASRHAAEIARDRYQSGAATQLDVVQAERDAFGSEVNQIQAQADLAYSRAELRLNAGQSLEGGHQ